jgi:hypothetical protein
VVLFVEEVDGAIESEEGECCRIGDIGRGRGGGIGISNLRFLKLIRAEEVLISDVFEPRGSGTTFVVLLLLLFPMEFDKGRRKARNCSGLIKEEETENREELEEAELRVESEEDTNEDIGVEDDCTEERCDEEEEERET